MLFVCVSTGLSSIIYLFLFKKMFPSRQKELCGFPGCKYNGQRRSFKRHNKLVHGGQAVVLKNDAFGVGGRWGTWVDTGKL